MEKDFILYNGAKYIRIDSENELSNDELRKIDSVYQTLQEATRIANEKMYSGYLHQYKVPKGYVKDVENFGKQLKTIIAKMNGLTKK